MIFIFKMAWRDSRASRRRLVLVAVSVVLGIAALVGIGSFADNLQHTVATQTKSLVGADLTLTSRQPFSAAAQSAFRAVGGERADDVGLNTMIDFPGPDHRRRLVQVRAISGAFPFYGELVTEPAGAMAALSTGRSALLEETLMIQFGVQAGDTVSIGGTPFTVAGALRKIPGESAAVATFSPRVFVSRASLEATGLLDRRGFVTYREHFKLPPTVDPAAVVQDLKERFAAARWRFATVAERQRDLGRSLHDVYSFIGLVGFVALFLGAVGVASAMHVYVRQKIATVAVLRCLGASARTSFAIYLVQGCGVGLIGAVAGAALGVAVQGALPLVLKGLLPFAVDVFVSWPAVGKGAAAGFVICVLFTLLPLLAVRRVSPLLAIRSSQGQATKRDPWRFAIYGGIALAVFGFAVWQAGNWRTGAGFTLALAGGFGALAGLARIVAWTARRFAPRRRLPYVWRQGFANLHRPNNRTALLLLSLGLGTFLMLTLVLTRQTLVAKILGLGEGARPNLMFFDIQDDQMAGVAALVKENGMALLAEAPMVTMKLATLKGRPVEEVLQDEKSGVPGWTLRRDYRSTYRSELSDTETVVAGRFVGQVAAGEARVPVSLEVDLAKDLHVQLGDELGFDIQGVPVTTYVASLREVEWQRLQPNFFVVFPTGVLEAAPKTFVAAVHADTPADSARLQQAVGKAFPSVSAIDLALILETVTGILAKGSFVVSFMAAFTVATGVIVLVGAVSTGRFQRLRETVLLRTLGATRRQLRQIQLVEYAVLGALAALTGGGLAVGANALLAVWVFKAPLVLSPLTVGLAVAASVLVTVIAGLATSRGLVNHPPLAVLRQET
jgi:putative ABC transport system permease protein